MRPVGVYRLLAKISFVRYDIGMIKLSIMIRRTISRCSTGYWDWRHNDDASLAERVCIVVLVYYDTMHVHVAAMYYEIY